ncbi:LTA synthase family protein [Dyella sp.]|jgi:phosphoglycerol transferase MdoB-like AlkP superfamily enzyme|uniref:LTA synthase family protein n=1 Tax=Dyella sp. TaxID=1869338 RepID=UPI002D78F43D|nr:LTA synthase family protein [Dyella sp.]HET6430764.1 LTA synthase family protein [Dyella sp.]
MSHPRATLLTRRPFWQRACALVLMALAFALVTGWIDGGVGVQPHRMLDQPRYVIANALPGLLLAGVLLALTRRAVLSFALALLAEALVFAVNVLKVANLGTPLIPADFRMVGQLNKGGAHLLGAYLPHSPWPYLAIIAMVAVVVALWRVEPPVLAARPRASRLAGGAVSLVLLATLLAGTPPWGKLYNGQRLWLEPWSATSTATHSGLISSLMIYHLQYGHGAQKADPVAARELLARTRDALRGRLAAAGGDTSALPDIVVVQSESFFDPRILKGLEDTHLTPNLDRLARHGTSGALYVPTFGGGTIRTEFEVLTGLSLRYFQQLQFPYLQLNARVVPGLVRTLNEHGYETVAIHGNDPSFWNRTSAFKAIGFDRFVSQSAFPPDAPADGKYMADRAMTDEILAQLRGTGAPQFLFAISIEAHGPYDTIPADREARDAMPVPPGVTGEDKLELQNYLYHIHHADQELGRLAEQLAKRDRPTLLLFYGDHLPALTNTFQTAGFVDGGDMLGEPGTWLLVDTRDAGQPVHENLAAWMLPGKLLDTAGIHDDAYFALTQLMVPQLADLTRAPGAPQVPEDPARKRADQDMASVSMLQLDGKLGPLLPAVEPSPAGGDTRYAEHTAPAVPAHGVQ